MILALFRVTTFYFIFRMFNAGMRLYNSCEDEDIIKMDGIGKWSNPEQLRDRKSREIEVIFDCSTDG